MEVQVCEAGVPTPAKRVFSRKILQAEVERLAEDIQNRRMMGELDPQAVAPISLSNVSHLVTDLWMDGDKLMAEIEVLDTPMGKTLKHILDNNGKVNFSMVGLGNAEIGNNGVGTIKEGYKLIQIAAVPALPGEKTADKLTTKKKYRSIDDPWMAFEALFGGNSDETIK